MLTVISIFQGPVGPLGPPGQAVSCYNYLFAINQKHTYVLII